MNVDELCQGLVGLIYPLANRQRGVSVSLDVERHDANDQTDTKKFQQVVFNLLNNAVKFSDPTR
jgi:signal transduction histidine kinase